VELDQDLADAGESRQYIDLIWGAVLTRYLTMARFGGLGNVRSAGRVQTPTLALVVEKERERQAFVPEDYWVISGELEADIGFKATHATARFKDKDAADAALAKVTDAKTATVREVERKSAHRAPPAPFNTTSMQAAAAAEGISPARAMRLAESLYMRRPHLLSARGQHRLPEVARPARAREGRSPPCRSTAPTCQAAPRQGPLHRHPRQAGDHRPPAHLSHRLPPPGQPPAGGVEALQPHRAPLPGHPHGPATIEGTKVGLDVAGEPFQATGDVLVCRASAPSTPYGLKKDEQLPQLERAMSATSSPATSTPSRRSRPPATARASSSRRWRRQGLGTKSTRASIIERLYDVKYLKNDPIEPSQLGMAIIDALTSTRRTSRRPR
jgi:DNA topoisomerase-1